VEHSVAHVPDAPHAQAWIAVLRVVTPAGFNDPQHSAQALAVADMAQLAGEPTSPVAPESAGGNVAPESVEKPVPVSGLTVGLPESGVP
jgi:hypothetical protein